MKQLNNLTKPVNDNNIALTYGTIEDILIFTRKLKK